jgi:hypothetical protein
MGATGDVKLMAALTMKSIADAVVEAKHAEAEEVAKIVADLWAMSSDRSTVMGLPRVVQAWGGCSDPAGPRVSPSRSAPRRPYLRVAPGYAP